MEFGTKFVNGKPWNTLECHEIKNLANQQHFQGNVGLKKFSLCRLWSELE